MSALDTQVGGTHYRQGGIQPVQYIEANNLSYLEGSVVKRVTRHEKVGGKGRQDIEKAIHELQLLLELRYPQTGLQSPHPKVDTSNWPKVVQGNPSIDQAMEQYVHSTVDRILGS